MSLFGIGAGLLGSWLGNKSQDKYYQQSLAMLEQEKKQRNKDAQSVLKLSNNPYLTEAYKQRLADINKTNQVMEKGVRDYYSDTPDKGVEQATRLKLSGNAMKQKADTEYGNAQYQNQVQAAQNAAAIRSGNTSLTSAMAGLNMQRTSPFQNAMSDLGSILGNIEQQKAVDEAMKILKTQGVNVGYDEVASFKPSGGYAQEQSLKYQPLDFNKLFPNRAKLFNMRGY